MLEVAADHRVEDESTVAPARLRGRARRHWIFLVLLVLGAGARVLTQLGFRPAVWYNDSFEYLGVALRWQAYPIRPNGYSAFLWLLSPLHSIGAVTALQHLLGLGVAVAGYALLVRRRTRPWLAALASVPVLLNPYQVQLEHLVMSDTLFLALVVAALVVLHWFDRPGPVATAVVGLLLAAASLTRSLGPALIALVGVYLLVRWSGWRAVVAFAVAAALPLVGYAAWFRAEHGEFATTTSEGIFLYSRVAVFADCARIRPPEDLRVLCDDRVAGSRLTFSSDYIWFPESPLNRIPLSDNATAEEPADLFDQARNAKALDFAILAIRAQPLDYAEVVLRDIGRTFQWHRDVFPRPFTYHLYELSTEPFAPPAGRVFVLGGTWQQDLREYAHGDARTRVVQPYADWAIAYQKHGAIPGPVLAAILLFALGTIAARRGRDSRRPAAAMLLVAGVALLVLPPMTAQFDHRYVLPAIPLACWAAALGAAILWPRPEEGTE